MSQIKKVDRTGVRFTYKFGSSFEERKIEELERKLNKLIKERWNEETREESIWERKRFYISNG